MSPSPSCASRAAVSLLVLLVVIGASACGGDEGGERSGDPGKAGTIYGPKMGGPIELSASEQVIVFGTAAAVSRGGMNHLFLIPHEADTPGFRRAYLSIWMPGNGWAAGAFDGNTPGLGARIELITNDGRQFALDVASSAASRTSFRLDVHRTESPLNDGVHYMTGRVRATLQGVTDPSQSAPLNFTINAPTN